MAGPLLLNVARWITRSRVNGPGERFVLWLQGCSLRCPGCWNPDTWSHAPRQVLPIDAVLAEVSDDAPYVLRSDSPTVSLSAADGDFIASLMKSEVEQGRFASWISAPKVGIDNKPGDFEYVKIAA